MKGLRYRERDNLSLLLLVLFFMVCTFGVLYSPLGPFVSTPEDVDITPSGPDAVEAYNPDNLRQTEPDGQEEGPVQPEENPGENKTETDEVSGSPQDEADQPTSVYVPSGPKLAFVIDDWGYSWPAADGFLQLDAPLTYAFLPFQVNTRAQAQRAKAAGYEVILHLPMETMGSSNPGKGAILTTLTQEEIQARVIDALNSVPEAIGVNNHMGSRATSDRRVMSEVLPVLRNRGLFFVDSHTSRQSVVPEVAEQVGVPYAQNSLFIDNEAQVDSIKNRIWQAAETAQNRGSAIAIGHVKPETLQALQETIPELKSRGFQLVAVSQLLKPMGSQPPPASQRTAPDGGPRRQQPEGIRETPVTPATVR